MMREHPIEGLMSVAMSSIKDMIDVNTIIGDPIQTNNNISIVPISKVSFGFAAGGSEFNEETIDQYNRKEKEEMIQYKLPFGGGSGAGVSINPIAFLVIQDGTVKLLPVNHSSAIDRLLDYIPDLFDKANGIINRSVKNECKEELKEIINDEKNKQKNEKENYEKNNEENKKRYEYEVEYNEIEEQEDD